MTYICDAGACARDSRGRSGVLPGEHCWHESAHRRLIQCYGEQRANRITLGIDAKTQADISTWNRLGMSDAVAS